MEAAEKELPFSDQRPFLRCELLDLGDHVADCKHFLRGSRQKRSRGLICLIQKACPRSAAALCINGVACGPVDTVYSFCLYHTGKSSVTQH